MQERTIDRRSLTVWRIRLSLVALVPAVVAAALFAPFSAPWWWINGSWIAVYLFGFVYYLPRFVSGYRYRLDERLLVMTCGVFYRFQYTMPLARVQYVLRSQWPTERLCGVATLVVHAAGGRIVLMHLDPAEAERLLQQLKGGMP